MRVRRLCASGAEEGESAMNLHPGMDAASPLDHLLSGPGWLRMTTREGMLCGVWRAVQAEHGGGDKRIGDQSKTSERGLERQLP